MATKKANSSKKRAGARKPAKTSSSKKAGATKTSRKSTKTSSRKPVRESSATTSSRKAVRESSAKKARGRGRVMVAIAATVGAAAGAAVGAAIAERAACTITTRIQVSGVVLGFLRRAVKPSAVESNDFVTDIPVSPTARRNWAAPINADVRAQGCDPGGFGPADCANAGTVRDIVNSLAAALHVS